MDWLLCGVNLLAAGHLKPSLHSAPHIFKRHILIRRVWEGGLMQDPQGVQAGTELLGLHGGTVVGHQGPGQSPFLERLTEPMHQGLGGLVPIPLEMADQAGVVVEDAQQQRGCPGTGRGQHRDRPMMEVGVPEAVDVLGLVAAHLQLFQAPFRLPGTGGIALWRPLAEVPPCLEVAPDGAIGGDRPQGLVLCRQGQQVVVVQLDRPARVLPVLGLERLDDGSREPACPPGIAATPAA